MEPSDLPKIWGAPDHSRLTPKQISIRLPIKIAAKISALNDMYPAKSKTEIISDLLASALDQLETALPSKDLGRILGHDPDDGEPIYEDHSGPLKEFRSKTERYLSDLEKELGMNHPEESSSSEQIRDRSVPGHVKSSKRKQKGKKK